MRNTDNIYRQIRDYLGVTEVGINILEEQINAETQVEYFEFSKNFKFKKSEKEIIDNKEIIFDFGVPIDKKKETLVQLATLNNIEAFRAIEKYLNLPNIKLYDWACIAFQESKLLIESKLLEENKILISTGLGGKGLKLRYFIVFFTPNGKNITKLQEDLIYKEAKYFLEKANAEIEEVDFSLNVATLLTVIPIQASVHSIFKNIIQECNQMGDFLFDDFIITNVKKLDSEEIDAMLSVNDIY